MKDIDGSKREVMNDAVKAALPEGEKMHVYYSVYKTSKTTGLPLNNLNTIAVRGKVIITESREEFWGGKESESYQSDVLENPTWLDIAVAANAMIITVRDFHHIFIEGVYARKGKKINGIKVYSFAMGS